MHPARRFAATAVAPTAVDVGLLVVLRQVVGLPIIVADLSAIAVASVVSYGAHRMATFRSNPYARWVRHPGAFVLVAALAAIVDAVVLRTTFAAAGYTSVGGLLVAKALSLSVAALVRALGYRFILAEEVVENRQIQPRSPATGPVRLSVVLPAFGEEERIGSTIESIRTELADVENDGGLEIIVVDDGSRDHTSDAALAAGADQVLTLPRNRGKGAAVRAGVSASRGRVVAFTDADLAYGPDHLRSLLAEVERGWDVVIGNRRHPQSSGRADSSLRAIGSRVVNRLASLVLLAAPLDTQCGLKGFHGDVARSIFTRTRIDGFAFDIEVLHLVERAEWSLQEIPVRLEATSGGSTVRIIADVVRLFADLCRVRYWASTGAYEADSRARLAPDG